VNVFWCVRPDGRPPLSPNTDPLAAVPMPIVPLMTPVEELMLRPAGRPQRRVDQGCRRRSNWR